MLRVVNPLSFKDPSKDLFKKILGLQAETTADKLAQAQAQAKETLLPQQTALAQSQLGAQQQLLPQQTSTASQLLGLKAPQAQAALGLTQAQTKGVEAKTALAPELARIAELKAQSGLPETKAAATQLQAFNKQNNAVASDSSTSANLLSTLDRSINMIPTASSALGPAGSRLIAWNSTAGQQLSSLLSKLQAIKFSEAKNIRTQREFDKIISQVGTMKMSPEALEHALNRYRNEMYQNIRKSHFYSDFSKVGGTNVANAENGWTQNVLHEEADAAKNGLLGTASRFHRASDGRIYSASELRRIIASQGGGQ